MRTTTLMQAIVYGHNASGGVLELQEVDKPVPADDEVLIKVRAASVNPLEEGHARGKVIISVDPR